MAPEQEPVRINTDIRPEISCWQGEVMDLLINIDIKSMAILYNTLLKLRDLKTILKII